MKLWLSSLTAEPWKFFLAMALELDCERIVISLGFMGISEELMQEAVQKERGNCRTNSIETEGYYHSLTQHRAS